MNLGRSTQSHGGDGGFPISVRSYRPCGANGIIHKFESKTVVGAQVGVMRRCGCPTRIRLFCSHIATYHVHVKVLYSNNFKVVIEELVAVASASRQLSCVDGRSTQAVSHLPHRVRVWFDVDVEFGLSIVIEWLVADTWARSARGASRILKHAFDHKVALFGRLACLYRRVKANFKRGCHWSWRD